MDAACLLDHYQMGLALVAGHKVMLTAELGALVHSMIDRVEDMVRTLAVELVRTGLRRLCHKVQRKDLAPEEHYSSVVLLLDRARHTARSVLRPMMVEVPEGGVVGMGAGHLALRDFLLCCHQPMAMHMVMELAHLVEPRALLRLSLEPYWEEDVAALDLVAIVEQRVACFVAFLGGTRNQVEDNQDIHWVVVDNMVVAEHD